jgi:selenocysteine-specific elongation factor
MTVVIGTAGHIDHGKTTLLRALTGIDADRLPEERRRGMTIDVGFAHLVLDDGSELDFVDVPGHDKLVGNMLVGAGEIDAALVVIAADDGPRAQTREHLALLDALGIRDGVAVVTKADAVEPDRVAEVVDEVRTLLGGTTLAAAPVLAVSGVSGAGLDALRAALVSVRDSVVARSSGRPSVHASLAIDRVFTVKGRGVVVTGTLRGGRLERGTSLRIVPGDRVVRVRELQVHGATVESADPGRTALNLAGVEESALHRGLVLTSDPDVAASSRVMVRLRARLPDRTRARLHLGTAAVDVAIGRSGRDAIDLPDGSAVAILRLAEPIAVAPGDPFVLRRSGGTDPIVGGAVLDVEPPRAVSRRRQTVERVATLADAVEADDTESWRAARLGLHGALVADGAVTLAPDVAETAGATALHTVTDATGSEVSLAIVRTAVVRTLRRAATLRREDAATAATTVIEGQVRAGRLVRAGDRVHLPGVVASAPDPALAAAMDRLERALAVASPPSLAVAARTAGCPPAGLRELERSGRIVVLAPDLAYSMSTYRDLAARALAMAATGPLTPAAYRDATGTSRKYVMAILEDLDRRAILRRTDAGHVPGPRAPARREPV